MNSSAPNVVILVRGAELSPEPSQRFVPIAADALPPLDRPPTAAQIPGTLRPGAWVDVLAARPLAEAGYPLWDAPTTILKHLGVIARRRAGEFLGLEEVQQMPPVLSGFELRPCPMALGDPSPVAGRGLG